MRRICVIPRKVTKCTKLRGTQRSPELALRSTDFYAPENLILPTLSWKVNIFILNFKLIDSFSINKQIIIINIIMQT